MVTIGGLSVLRMGLGMWQAPDALDSGHAQWLMIFVALAAIALFIQAIVFVVMGLGAMKAQKRAMAIAEEVRALAVPLLTKSHALVDELTPKVREITANVAEIAEVAKKKVNEIEPTIAAINETVDDANRKSRAQIGRFDGMITSALNATAEIAGTIHHGIRGPVREVAGLVTGVKTGIDTLLGFYSRASRPAPVAPKNPKVTTMPIPHAGPAPDAAPAAAAEVRNERSFADYREAMQAKRRDLDLS